MEEFDRPTHFILDDHNTVVAVDLMTWARWYETAENRVLAHWRTANPLSTGSGRIGDAEILVSTVFLGIDHSWGTGPPVLWETMAFGSGWEFDQMQDRYTSEADARAGHGEAVQLVIDARLTIKHLTNHELREILVGMWARLDDADRRDHIAELSYYEGMLTNLEAFPDRHLSAIAEAIRRGVEGENAIDLLELRDRQ